MSIKHSIAAKKRCAKVSAKEMSRRMSALNKRRWSKTSREERKKISRMLVKARSK